MTMGTDLATVAPACSTLAASEASFLLTVGSERDLSPEQFALTERIAGSSLMEPIRATHEDVRKVIGALAAILKAPRVSHDQGKLQLGLYRKALTGMPIAALSYAGDRALATLEWMPTPAELLRIADEFTYPEKVLHAKAKRIVMDRRQRLFEDRCKAIREGTFPESQFGELSPQEIALGYECRTILPKLDGSTVKWTLQGWKDDLAERKALTDAHIERSICAREGEKP